MTNQIRNPKVEGNGRLAPRSDFLIRISSLSSLLTSAASTGMSNSAP